MSTKFYQPNLVGSFGFLVVCLVIANHSYAIADAYSSKPITVESVGQPQVVYDTGRDGCTKLDIPDSTARAFRDSAGMIHLFGTNSLDHTANRELTGPDFAHLHYSCDIVYKGAVSANPADYNDNRWLDSFYVEGQTIYGLVHNEWHGSENKTLCPTGSPNCNEESVSEVYSKDNGFHFMSFPNGQGLVAAYPYQYHQPTHFFGIGGPTNIVKAGDYYYVMVAERHPEDTMNGVCVMRTNNLANPSSWRGWSGHDFSITFVNPYHMNVQDPTKHLCVPLSNGALYNAGSLSWVPARQTFLLLVRRQTWDKKRPGLIGDAPGEYLYESKDMINWSPPVLLLSDEQAGGGEQQYPALIDPESKDPNFATLGPTPLLFSMEHIKGAGYTSFKLVARPVKLGF